MIKALGERVFDEFLQGSAQRARAVAAVGAGLFDHSAFVVFGRLNLKLAMLQRLVHPVNQQADKGEQVVAERFEGDDFCPCAP